MSRASLLAVAIAVVVAALLINAFIQVRAEFAKEQEREAPVKTPSRVSTINHEATVTIDKQTLANSGIRLSALAASSGPLERQAYAAVLPVQDLVDSRNAFAAAKAQLDKARASLEVARKDYRRLDQLHNDDHNVSDKVFQASAAALATEQANVQAAQAALQTAASGVVQVYGETIAGWLANDAPILKRVLERQDVLLQVTLPFEAAAMAAPGTIRVQVAENISTPATLVARSPRTDPRIQGISYFYVASGRSLVSGMNVLAYLPTQTEASGVVVPQSAAVWWQGKAWVYVQRSPERFARVEVPADQPVRNGYVVRGGLGPNDQVVATGAQLLLSEELRSQIQVGEEGAAK